MKMPLTTLLRNTVLLPLVFATTLPVSQALAEVTPIKRVGGPYLQPALNAYSFLELLNANAKDSSQGLDLFALCDYAAQHNFDAIDLTGYFFPGYPNVPSDDYIYALKRHCHDRGLAISGTGVRNDFVNADPAIRAEGVKRLKDWIEVAAKLGAPVIRAFADSQAPSKNWQEASQNASREVVEGWVADGLRESAEYGKKFGVIVGVQNHGDFIASGPEHLSLLKRVDHPWCGAIVDTGKYHSADPYEDVALMAPYAVNWQIKESPFASLKEGLTDMKKLVNILRKSGYRGYVPIETLSRGRKDYDPYKLSAEMLREMREAIAATAPAAPLQPAK